MNFSKRQLWIILCFLMNFDLLNFKLSVLADQDFYQQCNNPKDRFCFGTTKSDDNTCLSRGDCYIASTYSLKSDSVNIHLIGKLEGSKRWIATAFSIDAHMGDDLVVMCAKSDTSEILHSLLRNDGRKGSINLPQEQQDKLELLKSDFKNGELSCEFKLAITKITVGKQIFDLQNSIGTLKDDGNIGIHSYKTVSGESHSLTMSDKKGIQSGSLNQYVFLKKIHGSLMVFSFMFLITVSVHVSRFYKESFVTLTICDRQLWFFVHIVFMCIAVFLSLCSIGVILFERNETGKSLLPDETEGKLMNHAYVGLAAIAIMIFQSTGMWVKPENVTTRKVLTLLHSVLGIAVFWMGWYCITFSHKDTSFGSETIEMLGMAHLGLHVVFMIALTCLQMCIDKDSDETAEDRYRALYIPIPRLMFDEPPHFKLRIYILVLDLCVFLTLALITIVTIFNYE